MTSPVPAPDGHATHTTRGDRIRDALAILLVVVGLCLIVAAHIGDSHLASQPIVVERGQSAFSQWLRFYYIELAGYGAVAAGLIVGLVSYAVHARRTRRSRTDATRST
jgi:hypothetical protein